MSEKRKWFDQQGESQQLIVLPGMRNTSPIDPAHWEELTKLLRQHPRVSAQTLSWISQLGTMPATVRLSKNLKVVLDKLQRGDTGHALKELVTEKEYAVLVELSLLNLPPTLLQVIYRLLNIGERFQAQTTLKTVFYSARAQADLPNWLDS